MGKKSIIIIIVCTLLFVAASFVTTRREPALEALYLSPEKIIVPEALEGIKPAAFRSDSPEIYLLIEVKHLTLENKIEVIWEKYEGDEYIVVQRDTIQPEQQGSGVISINMAKRDGRIPEGEYKVEAMLDKRRGIALDFTVR